VKLCNVGLLVFSTLLAGAQQQRQDSPSRTVPPRRPPVPIQHSVASYHPLRDINGQLYDFTEVVKYRTSPYFVEGAVTEQVDTGAFVTLTIDTPVFSGNEQLAPATALAVTGRLTIYDGMAIARTERNYRQIFVMGLPHGSDSRSTSFVAIPLGTQKIMAKGRTHTVPAWFYGVPVA
jgi:hypothetical protein